MYICVIIYVDVYHGSQTELESFRWRVSLSEAKLEWEPCPRAPRAPGGSFRTWVAN